MYVCGSLVPLLKSHNSCTQGHLKDDNKKDFKKRICFSRKVQENLNFNIPFC